MTTTASTDVYELLGSYVRQIADDSTFEVGLTWSAPGPVVVMIYSEKGGVGKTALTTGLAAVAASLGLQVLVIDLDPRATATAELGIVNPAYTLNDILYVSPDDDDPPDVRGAAQEYMVAPSPDWSPNIRVIAAERPLGNREMDNTEGMTDRLAAALDNGGLAGIDLVLMDVPPRPGGRLVATAGKVRNARALVPATLEPDGWIGAEDALTTLHRTRRSAGLPAMPIVGVLRHIVSRQRSAMTALYDGRMLNDPPLAEHVLGDVAVPRYGIRVESREMRVPITAATTPEARAIITAYTHVLNHIAKTG